MRGFQLLGCWDLGLGGITGDFLSLRKGSMYPNIVDSLAPKYLYRDYTLRPEYILH